MHGDRVADERRQGRGEGDRMCSCLMYRTTNDANYTNDKDRMDRRVGWISSKKLNIKSPLKFWNDKYCQVRKIL